MVAVNEIRKSIAEHFSDANGCKTHSDKETKLEEQKSRWNQRTQQEEKDRHFNK